MFIQATPDGRLRITHQGYVTITDKPMAIIMADGEKLDLDNGFKATQALPIPEDSERFDYHVDREYTTVENASSFCTLMHWLIEGIVFVKVVINHQGVTL